MLFLFSVLLLVSEVNSENYRLTNIKCKALDPAYCAFKQCSLNVLGRNDIGINLQVTLLKGPLKNAKANFSFLRKFNEFDPFMYNITFDFCKIMAKTNRKMSFFTILLDSIFAKSNLNHTCPYANEIVFRDLVLKKEHFRYLPLPSGEYQVHVMVATDGQWKGKIEISFLRKDD